jgi:hypothetical protein
MIVTLLSDELDGFKLLEAAPGNAYGGQHRPN